VKPSPARHSLLVWGAACVLGSTSLARSEASNSVSFGGYIESLQSGSFADDLDSTSARNLIQNRLELRWAPSTLPALSTDLETRNRLAWGEDLRAQPDLRSSFGRDPGWLDLDILPVDQAGAVLSLAVDRAWMDWNAGNWRLSVGRQRVNWGMALAWNPNDLFNAYDVLDLDYPERPGSDAVRLQVFPSIPLQFDLAAKADGTRDGVGALRLGWNLWETDFQALGGWYHDLDVVGVGWAANLDQAGFKGEASWFVPRSEAGRAALSATASLDYGLAEGSYVAASALYNGDAQGGMEALLAPGSGSGALSPENLFPSEWTFLVQATHPFSLILSGGTMILLAPDLDALVAIPSLDWNIAENWDLELRWESFLTWGNHGAGSAAGWRSVGNAGTLRLRRSF